MAQPSSRSELKDYCLRRLGFPVIDINVDEDQLEDRIDDALEAFQQYHYDGVEKTFLAHKITSADVKNKYINVPDCIIGVTRVMPYSGTTTSSTSSVGFNIFDINYQLRLNDFYNLTSSSYTYYVIAREHLAMLDMIVTGEVPFAFNKKAGKIEIFGDLGGKWQIGNYLCFEAVRILDPEDYYKIFTDIWVKKYTTALFKRQWGENMKKYDNYVLPGGITVNAQKIYDEAIAEIDKLELELRDTYEEPSPFFVG